MESISVTKMQGRTNTRHWRWRRRVTSTSTPTAPEEATLGTMAVGIKDFDLDKGLPLRMLAI